MSNTINNNVNTSRLSGLASGIDTEAMVESMTAATLSKIYKAEQNKQILEWKQEQYREITSMMTSFYNNYFKSSTGITSSSFFSVMSATSSSPYVKVSANSGASSGSMMISDIVSVATSSTMVGTSGATIPSSIAVDLSNLSSLGGKSMSVTINGQTKVITFSNKAYNTVEDVRAEMSMLINSAFGLDSVAITADDDKIYVNNTGGTIVIANAGDEDITDVLGFTSGQSNRLSTSAAISTLGYDSVGTSFKFTLNGVDFEFSNSATLNQIMSKVNNSSAGVTMTYSSITDKFTLTSKETGAGANISFSDTEGSLMSTLFGGTGVFTEGKNAEILVSTDGGQNFERVVRRSNNFDLNGLNLTLLGKASGNALENVSIDVSNDVNAVVDKIKKFAEDYNSLVNKLRTKFSEDKNKDYQPLTTAQRKEMSEDEIAKWEAKAKIGMLESDTILKTAYSSLRSALFADVKTLDNNTVSIGTVLAQIGISTGSYLSGDYGNLKIDEEKLKNALVNTPDKVTQLFTQKSNISYSPNLSSEQSIERYAQSGLAWRLSDILNNNIRTTRDSNGRKGTLLEAAGIENDTTSLTNTLYKKIKNMDRTIAKLKEMLNDEEKRYYSQFTSMEQALSRLNAQSSYFTNLFK